MSVVRRVVLAAFIVLVVAALPAYAHLQNAFPRVRMGASILATSGGGFVAGKAYTTRAAVVAWDRRFNSLTLYLLWRKRVTCGTLRSVITKPGNLIQVHVTDNPRVHVGWLMPEAQVAFLTVFRDPRRPTHIAGLKSGAQLTFTSVDTYPGGIWRGTFKVPTRAYGDGKVYGYNGTFAAKWCDLNR